MMRRVKDIIGMAALALAVAFGAWGAEITIGNSQFQYNNKITTHTISDFTVSAGQNRKLVVTVNSETAGDISGVTYAGQAFTKVVDTGSTRVADIWYLDAPPVGTADVLISFTGNDSSLSGVVSLKNAAPGGPVASKVLFGDSVSLTLPEANTFVIGCFTENGGAPIVGPFANELYMGNSGSSVSQAGYQNEPEAGEKTYTWQGNNQGPGLSIAAFAVAPPSYGLFMQTSE